MAVDGGTSGEDAEGKQTEERTVGVACHEVYEMNDAVAAYGMDCDDEDGKQYGHDDVDGFASSYV